MLTHCCVAGAQLSVLNGQWKLRVGGNKNPFVGNITGLTFNGWDILSGDDSVLKVEGGAMIAGTSRYNFVDE